MSFYGWRPYMPVATRRAQAAPNRVLDRVVTVRFDGNISNNLGWGFRPLQRSVQVKLRVQPAPTWRMKAKFLSESLRLSNAQSLPSKGEASNRSMLAR